jgi:hypothetical protein
MPRIRSKTKKENAATDVLNAESMSAEINALRERMTQLEQYSFAAIVQGTNL